jgi:hypothetical protein
MCFLFQSRNDFLETFEVGNANATRDGVLQGGQMTPNALCEFSSFCGRSDHECAAICFADRPGDQSAFGQAVEDTG